MTSSRIACQASASVSCDWPVFCDYHSQMNLWRFFWDTLLEAIVEIILDFLTK